MKNLHLCTLLILVFLSANLCAQDKINLVNGDVLSAKVVEITNNQIKYKKASNLTGPIYSVDKREVLGVQYENGEIDRFTTDRQLSSEYRFLKRYYYEGTAEIDRKEFENTLSVNPANFKAYKSGANIRRTGYVIMIPSAIAFAYGVIDFPWWQIGVEYDTTLMTVSAITSVGSMALYLIGDSKANKSIKTYNRKASGLGLNLNFNENGVGLVFSF